VLFAPSGKTLPGARDAGIAIGTDVPHVGHADFGQGLELDLHLGVSGTRNVAGGTGALIVSEGLDLGLRRLAIGSMNLAELDAVALGPGTVGAAPPERRRDAEVRIEGPREHRRRAEAHVERNGQHGLGWHAEQPAGRHLQPAPTHAIGQRFAGHGLEHAMEMPGRKVRHPCQRGEIERIGQMTVDVVDHAVDARDVGVARARQRPPRVTSGHTAGLTKI